MIGFASPERRPIVQVHIENGGVSHDVDCWVDTGFDGGLLLPEEVVETLGLQAGSCLTATLADGSTVEVQSYRASVIWDGQPRRVQVVAANAHPLIGLHLLHDHELRMVLTPGALVSIEGAD